MKTIDVAAANRAMREMMRELGLEDQPYNIDVIFWRFRDGRCEQSVRMSAFTKAGHCEQETGADWETTLERLRLAVRNAMQPHANSYDGGPMEVIVPDEAKP